MAWNQNPFQLLALESDSISFFGLESESDYPPGESLLGPFYDAGRSRLILPCNSDSIYRAKSFEVIPFRWITLNLFLMIIFRP